MRTSKLQHNLDRLRGFLELHQQEMADLAGCSRELIKSVEVKRTRLTERLAEAIFMATGVSTKWLLTNDLNAPIIDNLGEPYTRKAFDTAQAGDVPFPDGGAIARGQLAHQFDRLFASYRAAEKKGMKTSMLFRLRFLRMIEAMEKDFGWEKGHYKNNSVLTGLCDALDGDSPLVAMRRNRTRGA